MKTSPQNYSRGEVFPGDEKRNRNRVGTASCDGFLVLHPTVPVGTCDPPPSESTANTFHTLAGSPRGRTSKMKRGKADHDCIKL